MTGVQTCALPILIYSEFDTMLGIDSDMILSGLDFPPGMLKKMGCNIIFPIFIVLGVLNIWLYVYVNYIYVYIFILEMHV